jgi:hypothetical protein
MFVAPPKKCTIARRGGHCLAVASVPMVETSWWLEWPECSPTMAWLQLEQVEPPCCDFWERGGQNPPLHSKPCGTARWSTLSWPTARTVARSSSAHEGGVRVGPHGREGQAAEAVNDEHMAPKVNCFTMGKAPACQMFTIGGDGEHR